MLATPMPKTTEAPDSDIQILAGKVLQAIHYKTVAGITKLEGLCGTFDNVIWKTRQTSDKKQMLSIMWYVVLNKIDLTQDTKMMGILSKIED